jgi:hypothetical protein
MYHQTSTIHSLVHLAASWAHYTVGLMRHRTTTVHGPVRLECRSEALFFNSYRIDLNSW